MFSQKTGEMMHGIEMGHFSTNLRYRNLLESIFLSRFEVSPIKPFVLQWSRLNGQ